LRGSRFFSRFAVAGEGSWRPYSSATRERISAGRSKSKALEDSGHSVWWDRQLNAGERFCKEIDRALKTADLVVVLWSRTSVDSAWVQDEAPAGRDSNRLVPALIDRVEPPLKFRQYHALDLSAGRIGRSSIEPLLQTLRDRVDNVRRPASTRTRLPILCRAAGTWSRG